MKKKSAAIVIAFAMSIATLVGCGGGGSTSQKTEGASSSVEEANETEEQETDKEETASEPANQKTEDSVEEKTEETEEAEGDGTYSIGETWVVDGQWAITINGAQETEDRNEYSDKTPGAVYVVTYTYENLGYEEPDGLFISLDDSVIDSAGKMGYAYPGDITYHAKNTPTGAYCEAQVCIGVETPGIFNLQYSGRDGNGKKQTAVFEVDPTAEFAEVSHIGEYQSLAEYQMGETWEVDGQWKLTITGVQSTDDRNEYSDYEPAAVYIVSYTYENIGYEDEDGILDGLFISLDDMIIDSDGKIGYSYPGDVTNHPQELPVGATCDAQVCIGVDHAGDFVLGYSTYDGNETKQYAMLKCSVDNA